MNDAARGIGDNRPPSPIPLIEVEGLEQQLRNDWQHLFAARDELLKMVDDWVADHPKGIADAGDQAQATDVIARVLTEIDVIDKNSSTGIRAEVVGPLNKAVRAVNDFFKGQLADKLREAAAKINGPMQTWASAERRRLETDARQRQLQAEQQAAEEAVRRRAEADRLTAEAAASDDDAALDAAVLAEQEAMEAEAAQATAAAAPPPPASTARTYGDHNTRSNLVTRWAFRVLDADQVPRQYLMVNDAAIKAAMEGSRHRKGAPTIKIPGVEFYPDERMAVKR